MKHPDARQWPAVAVLTMAIATLLSIGLLDGGPLRAACVTLFLFIAPGWSILRLFTSVDDALQISLVVATSVAVVTLTSLALLYTQMWEPITLTVMLAIVSMACALAELRQRTREGAGASAAGESI